MIDLSPTELRIIIAPWAASHPLIRRIYLFGSRARGDHCSDSDVDLAVFHRIDPQCADGASSAFTARFYTRSDWMPVWRDELQRLLSVELDLHTVERDTERIWPSLKNCRVCLYRQGLVARGAAPG